MRISQKSGRNERVWVTAVTRTSAVAALCASWSTCDVQAQSVEEFYNGKRITLVVGAEVAGDYNRNGRLLARFMQKYIPGKPTIIVQNMPGATGMISANYLFQTAPRDGTVIGHFNQSMALFQATDAGNTKFKAEEFNWLGSFMRVVGVTIVASRTGVKTIEDAKKKAIVLGSTSTHGTMTTYPALLNNALGTKFDIVLGYAGGGSVDLAMERGEVDGRGAHNWVGIKAHPSWISENKINLLVQFAHYKEPDLPNVPAITELAENPQQAAVFKFISADTNMGMPFLAPPGVPVDRVAALREAFDLAIKDPEFIETCKRAGIDVTPISGAVVQRVAGEIISTPSDVVELSKKWMTR
jgi:tripartite-type tricarboxylate transporter receptor subunit TctC